MFLKQYSKKTKHVRNSKLGKQHTYYRYITIIVLKCDDCGADFERHKGSMDPKRVSNNYYHVCSGCDAKVFAQKKGVDRKKIWDLPASLDIPISKL